MIFQGTLLDLGGKFELNRLKNHDCFCLEGRHHLREALWARGTQRLTISLKKSGRHLSGISEQKKKQAHMEAAYEKRHPFFEILRFVRINRLHLWDWVKQVWGGRGWRCGWLAGIFVNMSSGRHFMECLEEKITELSINWPFHAQDPSLQFLWSWDIDYDQQSRERRKTKSLAEVGSKFSKGTFLWNTGQIGFHKWMLAEFQCEKKQALLMRMWESTAPAALSGKSSAVQMISFGLMRPLAWLAWPRPIQREGPRRKTREMWRPPARFPMLGMRHLHLPVGVSGWRACIAQWVSLLKIRRLRRCLTCNVGLRGSTQQAPAIHVSFWHPDKAVASENTADFVMEYIRIDPCLQKTPIKKKQKQLQLLEAYVDDPIGGWRSVLENQSKCMCHNGCIRCIGEALVPSKPSRPQDWQNFFITLPGTTVGNG